MSKVKLNQLIAVEKGVKSRTHSTISELYKIVQKSDLFSGHTRKYSPVNDEGETFPEENKSVQVSVKDVIRKFNSSVAEHLNVRSKIDWANNKATANLIVDSSVLVENVPVTHLLVLEKSLVDYATFIKALPTLSAEDVWEKDESSDLYKTSPVKTHKTKKVQKALVLYPATEKHPAQTQLITEDETIGHWDTTKISGAISQTDKEKILERVEKLINAVKFARESANNTEVDHLLNVEEKLLSYLSI